MSENTDVTEALLQGLSPDSDADEATETESTEQETAPSEAAESLSEEDQHTETEQETAQTLKSLAEKAGIDAKDLYALEVPGTGKTLGELKDQNKAFADMDSRSDELDERQSDIERTSMRTRLELQALASTIPPEMLTEANISKSRQQMEAHKAEQARLMIETVPEWAEETTKQADMKLITEYAAGYGIPPERAQMIVDMDAVTAKMWLDHARLTAKTKQIMKDGKVRKLHKQGPKTNRKVSPSGAADKIAAGVKSGQVSKADGITALMIEGLMEQ